VRVGLLGLFTTDLTDVRRERAAIAAELGFHGVGAHIDGPFFGIVQPHVRADRRKRALPTCGLLAASRLGGGSTRALDE
jgi:hypothetical protein